MSNPHPTGRRRATAVACAAVLAAGALAATPPAAALDHSAATAAFETEVVFSDDFASGADLWRTAGGSWSVTGAETYRQAASSGNARAFAGDPTWHNVVVAADATPASGSGASSFTAVLGRVQNTDTYYYLTLRNNDQLEINKLVGGSRTVLAEVPFAVDHGRSYTLAFELWFDELTGYVDGEPLVSAVDGDFTAGEVGLKTFNATAEFDEVVVEEVRDLEPPTVPPLETPIGYASMNGGTTGGFGAASYEEYVLSEYWPTSGYDEPGEAMYQLLREHRHNEDDGLVIYVDVTINEDDFGRSKMDVTDNFNVSILGVGDQGRLTGVGTTVRRSHNIVFRNLTIHHVSQGEGTAIEVTDDSSNIWIDHNEFYSELDNEPDKDYYDGLVDIKRNAEYVTVSWNYFHDHWKTMLLGHNDNENLAPDRITYHHNWFRNVNTRLPLARFADVHMLNNFFQDVTGSAINARMGAQILVEGNYFLRAGSGEIDTHADQIEGPVGWWYGSNETGYWNLRDNIFVDSPHEHLSSTTDFTVPYAYAADDPATARGLVEQYAGVGVIEVDP